MRGQLVGRECSGVLSGATTIRRINTKEWQRLQSAVTLRTPAKKSACHILLITFQRSEVTAGIPRMGEKERSADLEHFCQVLRWKTGSLPRGNYWHHVRQSRPIEVQRAEFVDETL